MDLMCDPCSRKHLMSCGKKEGLTFPTFMLLVENALLITMGKKPCKSLILNPMRVFSLGTHPLARLIESSTKG